MRPFYFLTMDIAALLNPSSPQEAVPPRPGARVDGHDRISQQYSSFFHPDHGQRIQRPQPMHPIIHLPQLVCHSLTLLRVTMVANKVPRWAATTARTLVHCFLQDQSRRTMLAERTRLCQTTAFLPSISPARQSIVCSTGSSVTLSQKAGD